MDRKSFLKDTGRWTILAIMAGLVWFLVRHRDVSGTNTCEENKFCKNCNRFGSCSLPQAKEQA